MRTRRARLRRPLAMGMAVGGLALLLLAQSASAQDAVRTESDLFGFDLESEAAPLSVRFFEPFIPIPTDPGDPQFELTASYTITTMGTGPTSRAEASSIWPGPALGDGFGSVVGDDSQSYPVRAEAIYPGGGEDSWEASTTIPGVDGFGMHASARGLDAIARSEGGGVPGPAQDVVSFGQIRSTSQSTVEGSQAMSSSVSEIHEVAILDGVITVDSVATHLQATSDGEAATTDGGTTIGGITVLGMPVTFTDQGFAVTPPDDGGGGDGGGGGTPGLGDLTDVLTAPVNQFFQQASKDLVGDGFEDALGIHFEAVDQHEKIDGAIGERTARGLRIRIDVATLKSYLQPLLSLAPTDQLIDALPSDLGPMSEYMDQLKGLLYEAQGLAPGIEVILGRGFAAASGTPPFELPDFSIPAPPPLPAAPPPTSTTTASAPISSGGVSLPPPTTTGTVAPPQTSVAPPETTAQPPVVAAGAELPEPYGGIPVALLGLALVVGAIPTWGLRTLRETAVGGTAATAPAQKLPDLRGGA